jgi:hypothetical protein
MASYRSYSSVTLFPNQLIPYKLLSAKRQMHQWKRHYFRQLIANQSPTGTFPISLAPTVHNRLVCIRANYRSMVMLAECADMSQKWRTTAQ